MKRCVCTTPRTQLCRYHHLCRKERVESLRRELLTGTGNMTNGRVVADVGCGTGSYFPVLCEVAERVTGVEIARPKRAGSALRSNPSADRSWLRNGAPATDCQVRSSTLQ